MNPSSLGSNDFRWPRLLFIQYLIGATLNFAFVIVLLSQSVTWKNLQLPEGEYKENIWQGSDVMDYVNPARNFLKFGVFGTGIQPDADRTIGYPLFLSALMKVFGKYWLRAVVFTQTFIFALMYPFLSVMARLLIAPSKAVINLSLLIWVFSAAYIATVPVLMSDLFFTVLFTIGLTLGLLSVVRESYLFLAGQLLFLGYAAQVRPILFMYPIVHLLVLCSIAKMYGSLRSRKTRAIITVSVALLLLLCNLTTLRNYIHYRLPEPTSGVSSNLFNSLGYEVLAAKGRLDRHKEMSDRAYSLPDIRERAHLMEKYAAEIFMRYPLTTLKLMCTHAIPNLFSSHWNEIGRFWGYAWRVKDPSARPELRKSEIVFALYIIWGLIYAAIYFFFGAFLVRLVRKKSYLYLLTVILFMTYFLVPTFIVQQGPRMRLPVEGILIFFGLAEMGNRIFGKGWYFDYRRCRRQPSHTP